MRKKFLILLLTISVWTSKLLASGGETVFPFLKINSSVKSAGLAGSDAATISGIQSVYLNPAGLSSLNKPQAYALYSRWFGGLNLGYLAFGKPLTDGNLAVAIGYQQFPKMLETVADPSVYKYRIIDKFRSFTGFGGVYYSKNFNFSGSSNIAGGAGIKIVGQRIGNYGSALTPAVDIGIITDTDLARYGISLSNISWGANYGGGWEKMPVILRIGGRWNYIQSKINDKFAIEENLFTPLETSSITVKESESGTMPPLQESPKTPVLTGFLLKYSVILGGEIRFKDGVYLRGGLEVAPYNFITFRCGYEYALKSNLLGGLGGASFGVTLTNPFVSERTVSIEYAISSFGRLGLTHRLGINFYL